MRAENVQETDDRGISVLEGSIERIIYANEENGYTVLELLVGTESVTAVGIIPCAGEGETIKAYGKWVHNSKYGRQFSVSSFEKVMPADEDAILRYLASGAIKGIGPKTAKKIIDTYGTDAFDVIENHSEWLAEIPGITLKKALQIGETFRENSGMRTTMMFFRKYFGAALTVRIYKRWGASSVERVKENPYILCEEIDGIGFERTDDMAQELGFSADSSDRICSGLLYMMKQRITREGHVCLPEEKLVAAGARLLEVDGGAVREALSRLYKEEKMRYIVYDGIKFVYERESYDDERYIAKKLLLLDSSCAAVDASDMTAFIENEEKKSGICYAPLQKKAISAALESGVMILTGGPGTGKTTVVKGLIDIFERIGLDVALAAPTGRAANRMSEATSREAKTVHRLLEMDFSGDAYRTFNRDETNLLEEEVIIIDEASMIDQPLMRALLAAIKPGARLIIIGDSDQLPSVGAGNVLHDIIGSGHFATIRLNEIFRQASESLIVTNAHKINKGEMPVLDIKDKDFFFLPRASAHEIAATVADLCKNRLPRAYGISNTESIQVISPSRRGEAGTENLNVLLRGALNPGGFGKKEYRYRNTVFRVGDRVMQTRNNYDIDWERADGTAGCGVFNGDIGIITDIDFAAQALEIVFDERRVSYDFSVLEELEHAYAITVHKSQGSEYPIVIIPAYRAPEMLLTRNMLYTAVTRAEKMVIVVGESEIVEKMVENNRQSLRYTGLERLFGERL